MLHFSLGTYVLERVHVTDNADDKRQRVEATIASLQHRFGLRSIRSAKQQEAIPTISTGFQQLDNALGVGGIPLGRVTEIVSSPTTGATTLALCLLVNAPGRTVFIDLDCSFNPAYAGQFGVDLSRLILVRPHPPRQGVAILQDFVIGGSVSAIVLDRPSHRPGMAEFDQTLSDTIGRLLTPLHRNKLAVIIVTSLPINKKTYPESSVPFYAAIRLQPHQQAFPLLCGHGKP